MSIVEPQADAATSPATTGIAQPYTPGVKPALINRILLFLGFFGLFDSGMLSAEKLFGLNLNCGVNGGCATVALHPTSMWFGIPVAYFGFAGYLTLAALAAVRAIRGLDNTRPLVTLGLGFAAFGALASIYLQYTMFVVIRAFCPYCFISALTMLTTLGLYLWLQKRLKQVDPESLKPRPSEITITSVGAVATCVAIFFGVAILQKNEAGALVVSNDILDKVPLIPLSNPHLYGKESAPIAIVEFADLCCPHCQLTTPKVEKFVDQYPGKVKSYWRHFPLIHAHKQAVVAALVSEYAGEKGKFWEFTTHLMSRHAEPETIEQVLGPAIEIGLNPDDITKRINNETDPMYDRVQVDTDAADKLGIESTPTFFIVCKGIPTKIVSATSLFNTLTEEPYKHIIMGHG